MIDIWSLYYKRITKKNLSPLLQSVPFEKKNYGLWFERDYAAAFFFVVTFLWPRTGSFERGVHVDDAHRMFFGLYEVPGYFLLAFLSRRERAGNQSEHGS